jgi:hypothetical protein
MFARRIPVNPQLKLRSLTFSVASRETPKGYSDRDAKSRFAIGIFAVDALSITDARDNAIRNGVRPPDYPATMVQSLSRTDAPSDLPRGLVLYFSFNEPPKNGVVRDQSGQHNNGQAAGVKWVADGHRGGGAEFGPGESRIRVPDNASLNPPQFTLTAWIKTTRKDSVYRRIFDKGTWNEDVGQDGYDLTMGGGHNGNASLGQVCIQVFKESADSKREVTDGKWHHVAGTFDGSTLQIYVDGTATAQVRATTPLGANSYDLAVGNSSDERAHSQDKPVFIGTMDDVMMFNRALSAGEISQLYESQK